VVVVVAAGKVVEVLVVDVLEVAVVSEDSDPEEQAAPNRATATVRTAILTDVVLCMVSPWSSRVRATLDAHRHPVSIGNASHRAKDFILRAGAKPSMQGSRRHS
jgi:hypothetical protein